MTNYEDTNDAVHHLRFLAELAEVRDEEAAFQSFEEHFKASAEDPYFEYELKLWLTAWRKALAYFTEQVAPVRRTSTTNNNADPVGSLVDQWREAAEFFTSGAGFDIRETLIDCADDLEAALAQQRAVHLASTHCDNCGCDWLDNGLNPIGCPYCKLSAETESLRETLAAMISWFPSADTYRRLGFNPETPMRVLKEAKVLLLKKDTHKGS